MISPTPRLSSRHPLRREPTPAHDFGREMRWTFIELSSILL